MNNSLFTNIENAKDVKPNMYEEVLEKRQRPAIPEEKISFEEDHEKNLKSEKDQKIQKKEPKIISIEEAKKKATAYFNDDELAGNVWINKYALKDSKGNLYEETPDDMHWRVAHETARIEKKYPNPLSAEEVYELFKDFKYIIPQGGPMAGIGNDFQISSLSNCFVIASTNCRPMSSDCCLYFARLLSNPLNILLCLRLLFIAKRITGGEWL